MAGEPEEVASGDWTRESGGESGNSGRSSLNLDWARAREEDCDRDLLLDWLSG